MRFLGVGDNCDLGALYLRLIEEGHDVRISIANPLCRGTLAGLVEQVPDWIAELPWIRAVGNDGIILFENVAKGRGEAQDALRRDGFEVDIVEDASSDAMHRAIDRLRVCPGS